MSSHQDVWILLEFIETSPSISMMLRYPHDSLSHNQDLSLAATSSPCNSNVARVIGHRPPSWVLSILSTSAANNTDATHQSKAKLIPKKRNMSETQKQCIFQHKTKEIPLHQFILPAAITSTSLLLLFLWFLTKFLLKPSKALARNLPPSPPKLPIIGNLHQLGSLPHHKLRSLAQKHGPLMLLRFGKVPALIVSSADAAREVMKTHDLVFADRPESSVSRRLLYDGKDVSAAPYGEYWRQMKSVCVLHLLSNRRVQSFHHIREEETALLTRRIERSSDPVNLSEMFVELTNDVVCRSAFGRKYSGEGGEIGKRFLLLLNEFLVLLSHISVGDFIPWLRWVDRVTGFDARVEKTVRALDEFLERVISDRGEGGMDGENFVDVLLDLNNASGLSIDRDSIKALILDVFAAGTDTTATVLEWAMAELIRHPTVMGKLQTEVRGVMENKHDMTEKDIEKMHYLKAVIKETLRCHTPIPLLVPRTAREDAVMVNAWAIGRDPALWDEADLFQPERFLKSSIDFKGQDFELIPFGAGRSCPGIAFAMTTNEFVLANLVNKFDWKFPKGTKVEDLNMAERPGVAIRRAVPLLAIASRCHVVM